MKPTLSIVACAAAFALHLPFTVWAAGAGTGPKARLFAQYDTNKNGVIDGDEVAAVRKALADDPRGPLGRYDSNSDGKLDDAEIAGIKPPGAGQKGEGRKGAGKKKDGEETKDEVGSAGAPIPDKPAGPK
jgi:hypothetical protein